MIVKALGKAGKLADHALSDDAVERGVTIVEATEPKRCEYCGVMMSPPDPQIVVPWLPWPLCIGDARAHGLLTEASR